MFIKTDKFNNSIEYMVVDYQGNLWFTSSRMGLLRMSKTIVDDIYYKAGLSEKVVNGVIAWQGMPDLAL